MSGVQEGEVVIDVQKAQGEAFPLLHLPRGAVASVAA
jgi:hypothetical protein